jgi:hypothetical protein
MRIRLAGQRVDETHVISQITQLRDEVRHHLSALAARSKFPGALCQVPLCSLESDQSVRSGHRLSVPTDQLRLVIERVEMTAGSGAEDHDNIFRSRRKVCITSGERPRRIDLRSNWRLAADGRFGIVRRRLGRASVTAQQLIASQQTGQRDATQTVSHIVHETTTISWPGVILIEQGFHHVEIPNVLSDME